ncbi:MFS transporter [Alphaproteobacteria bacterium]|nr:MFS transporter [Alphaproteobacteria bacterium]GHT90356.1 MFS transporter [Alphaproteobacteria bacterium]
MSLNDNSDNKKVSIPQTIWILGLVSFFSNSAAVVITALTPEFIINVLHSTPAAVGCIRGLSEAISYLVKMFSGVFSDWLGKRKILILIGYLCAAFTKPMFALSNGLGLYVTAQFLERITNGLRDTPRDALIADCAPKEVKGDSYGIRNSFAYFGSLVGSVVCVFILSNYSGTSADSIRLVYMIASLPIFISVLLIYFGIKEPKGIVPLKDRNGFPIKKSDIKQLGSKFWYYMLVCFIFMCSRYSEAFLALRAKEIGLSLKYVPLILAVMYLFNAPTSKIVGSWSDRRERKIFLALGFCMMMASCIIMALATEIWHVFVGAAIYGIHWGATQGTFYAMVTDYSPPQIKGTSIGIFNLVYSAGICVSNLLTGLLWTHSGADVALAVNGAIAFVAAISITFVKPNKQKVEVK